MPFTFEKLSIPEVILITPKVFEDDRGFFKETFKLSDFLIEGIRHCFVQDNHSFSKKNTLRGIHFQKDPKPQAKLVGCSVGKILDVAIDLRIDSPTFKKWVAVELSSLNHKMLFVPERFGHAFLTLSDFAEVS